MPRAPLSPRQSPLGGTPDCHAVDPVLPTNFQCASNEYCISVNEGTTGICCNDQVSCAELNPINCNVKLQDASLYPDANIFTVLLGLDLDTCGDGCCPLGYECTVDYSKPICSMLLDQSPQSVAMNYNPLFTSSPTLPPTSSSAPSTSTISSSQTESHDKITTILSTVTAGISSGHVETLVASETSSVLDTTPIYIPASNDALSNAVKACIGLSAAFGSIAILSLIAFVILMCKRRQVSTRQAPSEPSEPYEFQEQADSNIQHEGLKAEVPQSYAMSELSTDMVSRHTFISELPGDVSWYNAAGSPRQ